MKKPTREKERLRQRNKWQANKERYTGRDVDRGFIYFWSQRGVHLSHEKQISG